MDEPTPIQLPPVIRIHMWGAMVHSARMRLHLTPKKNDPALVARWAKEDEDERKARAEAGAIGLWGQRHPLEKNTNPDSKLVGTPNAYIGDFVKELIEMGYFLIGGYYGQEPKDEIVRDFAKIVFSRKKEDHPLSINSPSREELLSFFEENIYQYMHAHDNRRWHFGLKCEVGNTVIDVVGWQQPIKEYTGTFRKLYLTPQTVRVELARRISDAPREHRMTYTVAEKQAPLPTHDEAGRRIHDFRRMRV
jgi:hypothetical protein